MYRDNTILKTLIDAHELLEDSSVNKKRIMGELEELGLKNIDEAKELSQKLEDEYNKEAKKMIMGFPIK
jgi:hypothetical protein